MSVRFAAQICNKRVKSGRLRRRSGRPVLFHGFRALNRFGFHSFRHRVKAELVNADVRIEVAEVLQGRRRNCGRTSLAAMNAAESHDARAEADDGRDTSRRVIFAHAARRGAPGRPVRVRLRGVVGPGARVGLPGIPADSPSPSCLSYARKIPSWGARPDGIACRSSLGRPT